MLLSARFPISQARRFDLDLGYHADWVVLGVAALAVLITVIATRDRLRVLVGERAATGPGNAVDGRTVGRPGGLPPALAIGSRLAVEPGRGRRGSRCGRP